MCHLVVGGKLVDVWGGVWFAEIASPSQQNTEDRLDGGLPERGYQDPDDADHNLG